MPRQRRNNKQRPANKPTRRPRKFMKKKKLVRLQRKIVSEKGFGFPATKLIPMRYTTTVNIVGFTGTMGKYVFSANSIFDPDVTGTGHQPQGHDQWMTFYSRYTVIGSKIRVYCNDSAITQTFPFVFGIQLNNDQVSTSSDFIQLIEQGREKFSIHNSNFDARRSVSHGYSMKKFFSLANAKDNMLTHGAHFGSNPTEQAFYTVWSQDQLKTNTVNNSFLVIIDYAVLLSEPNNLPQS